jgi:hypothetical protein
MENLYMKTVDLKILSSLTSDVMLESQNSS